MASLSNRERVGRALDAMAAGVGPWMDQALAGKYGRPWREPVRRITGDPRDLQWNMSDPNLLVWLFDKMWIPLFRQAAGENHEFKRCMSGLWDARRAWAHPKGKFTDEQAERALSDAEYVLRQVGAVGPADDVADLRRDLRRIRYEKDQDRWRREAEKGLSVVVDAHGLAPWRDVIEPHDDVAEGRFELAQFAADLRLVAAGAAGAEYGDPVQFFERTYLTRGLRYLLAQTARRMAGKGGEPVVDLMTTFGGGKTHSQIAVYHLGSGTPVDRMPGVRELLTEAGVVELPDGVSRVVIVGNDLSVLGSQKPDGTEVRTLWGEIAWQLGGRAGYDMLARYDEGGDPPPTSDLQRLLEAHAPAIILIDEWVAYLRQLYSRPEPAPAGTFDSHMTFVQSLTEAVKAVPTAMLVVSLPASDNVRDMGQGVQAEERVGNVFEIGGTPGLVALQSLRSVIHRVESPWQPADTEESFEIVRRRIFKPLATQRIAARDLVVRRFDDFYQRNPQHFPSEARQPGYAAAMRAAYPIHPELFKRLYEDWSTLERFQRTRGVLRLMATVVHALWMRGDTAPLITPATIPLDDLKVFEEITTHLDDPWKPVVDTDIAGEDSTAAVIDRETPLHGQKMNARRVARCVFLGTAPAAHQLRHGGGAGPVQGIESKRVVLGSAYPSDNPAHLADALRMLGDRGAYMNRDTDRFWLSLRQTVQRLVRERAEAYTDDEVASELAATLRAESDRGVFDRVHRVPADSADVEDDPSAGLVVFGTDRAFTRRIESEAQKAALRFLQFRGASARINKNSLLFLAPDLDRVDTLHEAVRLKLAWDYVLSDVDALNLDQHSIHVARERLAVAKRTVADRVRDTYRWLLVPHQEPGAREVELEAIILEGSGTLVERVTRKAKANEIVLRSYTPSLLRREIDKLGLWDREPHVRVDRLCDLYTQYLYMPKIGNQQVILDAVKHLSSVLLVDTDGIAYADSVDEDGRYRGLAIDDDPVSVSRSGLVVKPTAARAQVEAPTNPDDQDTSRGGGGGTIPPDRTDRSGGTPPPPPPRRTGPTRFHATKKLDPMRVVRDISQLSEEILIHFTSAGVPVNITVDIDSDALARLPDTTRSIIEENLAALAFDDWGME